MASVPATRLVCLYDVKEAFKHERLENNFDRENAPSFELFKLEESISQYFIFTLIRR